MRRFVGVVLLTAAMAACSSGSSGGGGSGNTQTVPLMAGFNPGPAPDPSKGFQVILPIVGDIPAGGSQEYCTWTNVILPQDVWVKSTEGFQTQTGHHVVMFYSTSPQAPDTHICGNDEMAEFKFGMPASAGEGSSTTVLPADLAIKLPAGAQVVINHHYLNASATDVPQAQSALNVYYADPGAMLVPSGSVVITNSSMTVPTGASSYSVDCTINNSYAAWQMLPHMHAWGTHITVTNTPATGAAAQQLFDLDWDPDYAFDIASVSKDPGPSAPFMFNTGDKIHIQCDYMNTTSAALDFGSEMCVFFAMTVDSSNIGNMLCDTGQWGPY